MIRAIETTYKGYRFRSRLEARWAVFFDALGVEWQYEPEGYLLEDTTAYLPDFWLETVRMWAEVKALPLTGEERRKCRQLACGTGSPVLMLVGPPTPRNYWAFEPEGRYQEFAAIDPEIGLVTDFLLTDEYLDREHRFFACTGAEEGELFEPPWLSDRTERAYQAARSARFEHGERG